MMADKILKRGQVAVDKKRVINFLSLVSEVERAIDFIMKEPESADRGKRIAGQINRLTFSRQSIQHFDFNVPLNKLK